VKSQAIFKISKGRPNVIDLIEEKKVAWIVNTRPAVSNPTRRDQMRAHAVIRGNTDYNHDDGLRAAINGLEVLREMQHMEVCSLQEFHRHAPKTALSKKKSSRKFGPVRQGHNHGSEMELAARSGTRMRSLPWRTEPS